MPPVELVVPMLSNGSLASLAAEAKQARIVPQRSLSGMLATGLAPVRRARRVTLSWC